MHSSPSTEVLIEQLTHPGERRRLIAAFIAGTLPQAQEEAFEIRLLEDPALLDEVECEQVLRESLRSLPEHEVLGAANDAAERDHTRAPARHWLNRRVGFALAAGLALGYVIPASLSRIGGLGAPQAEAAVVLSISDVRSAQSETREPIRLHVPPGTKRIVLQVPAPMGEGPFRVLLLRQSGERVGDPLSATPDGRGWLGASWNAQALVPDHYVLHVERRTAAGWQPVSTDTIELKKG